MKKVIHMAAECMLFEELSPDEFEAALFKFAELVRADEREACAKVIESHGPTLANGAVLAEAIRARGQA